MKQLDGQFADWQFGDAKTVSFGSLPRVLSIVAYLGYYENSTGLKCGQLKKFFSWGHI